MFFSNKIVILNDLSRLPSEYLINKKGVGTYCLTPSTGSRMAFPWVKQQHPHPGKYHYSH